LLLLVFQVVIWIDCIAHWRVDMAHAAVLEDIKTLMRNRWEEAHTRPLPSDDPYDQVLFFAGMADEPGKVLGDSEQADLRSFIFDVVGIAEEDR
jgi:hypothetical protein